MTAAWAASREAGNLLFPQDTSLELRSAPQAPVLPPPLLSDRSTALPGQVLVLGNSLPLGAVLVISYEKRSPGPDAGLEPPGLSLSHLQVR